MLAIDRESGDRWGVHWDWFAHMWYVEPPFDVELDEPIKWFNERSDAFEFVDDWIRKQPVQVSILDQVGVEERFAEPNPVSPEFLGEEVHTVYPLRGTTVVHEPARVVEGTSPVYVPNIGEARNEREARLAKYAATVGLK